MSRVVSRYILATGVIVLIVAMIAVGQLLSGALDLGLIARRIPTTVDGEITLDTPSEFTSFEFAVSSGLDITLRTGFFEPRVMAAVNTAGIEHFVFHSPINLRNLVFFGLGFDRFSFAPEVWVAVPFESAVDVNGLSNSVVIPPGNPMFVSARTTFSTSMGGFDFEHLVMLEDVNFPSPSAPFEPLFYDLEDQEFATGCLTSASWRAGIGWSMRAEIGLSASRGGKSIKGHSATGKVTPDSSFARVNISGIQLGKTSLLGIGVQDVVLGTSFSVATGSDEAFSTTISISGPAWEGANLSTSMTLTSSPTHMINVSGITLTGTQGPFKMSIALDELEIKGLSANCGSSLNLGSISGSWAISASGIERGLTGLSFRLMLSEGVFSTNTALTFSQRGDTFGFASWASSLTFRFSPAVVSVQVAFGRNGLTRASVVTSVSF